MRLKLLMILLLSHAHQKTNKDYEYQLKHALFLEIIKIILNSSGSSFPILGNLFKQRMGIQETCTLLFYLPSAINVFSLSSIPKTTMNG